MPQTPPTHETDIPNRISNLRQEFQSNRAFLEKVADLLPEWMGAERGSVFIYDPSMQRAILAFGTQMDSEELDVPMRGSIVGDVISSSTPILRDNLSERRGVHKDVDQLTEFQTKDLICVPIFETTYTKTIGALELLNQCRNRPFDDTDVTILTEVAKRLSPAMEKLASAYIKDNNTLPDKGYFASISNFFKGSS